MEFDVAFRHIEVGRGWKEQMRLRLLGLHHKVSIYSKEFGYFLIPALLESLVILTGYLPAKIKYAEPIGTIKEAVSEFS